MNPRIISTVFIAIAMMLASTSCMAAQKRHKTATCESQPAHQSQLFQVWLAEPGSKGTIGPKIGTPMIKVKGDRIELVFDWDEPKGSYTSDFQPTGFWIKWGDGKWIQVKRERHGTRYVVTINNQKNNKEYMLSIMTTFKQVTTHYDEYGELVTDTQANVATATRVYKVKHYKY